MRWGAAAAVAVVMLLGGGSFEPARFRSGQAPRLPVRATGGGHVVLEVKVGVDGQAFGVTVLRSAAPFTDALRISVARWRFEPARTDGAPVETSVLVAAWFRSPALIESAGPLEFPAEDERASGAIPLPIVVGVPAYPVAALGEGVAVVEVTVDGEGGVRSARVVLSAAGFDSAAMDAARRWRFRPASRWYEAEITLLHVAPFVPSVATSTFPPGVSPLMLEPMPHDAVLEELRRFAQPAARPRGSASTPSSGTGAR